MWDLCERVVWGDHNIIGTFNLITQKPFVRVLIEINQRFPKNNMLINYCIKRNKLSSFWKKEVLRYLKIWCLNIILKYFKYYIYVLWHYFRIQIGGYQLSIMFGESPCIIKQWFHLGIVLCERSINKVSEKDYYAWIVPFNERSRIRIEILWLYLQGFIFIFKAAYSRCGRKDFESNIVDYTIVKVYWVSDVAGSSAYFGILCFCSESQVKNNGLGFGMRAKVVRCLYNIIVMVLATELNNYI